MTRNRVPSHSSNPGVRSFSPSKTATSSHTSNKPGGNACSPFPQAASLSTAEHTEEKQSLFYLFSRTNCFEQLSSCLNLFCFTFSQKYKCSLRSTCDCYAFLSFSRTVKELVVINMIYGFFLFKLEVWPPQLAWPHHILQSLCQVQHCADITVGTALTPIYYCALSLCKLRAIEQRM